MNKPRLIDANELIEVVKNIQNHMKEVNEKPVPVDAREIFSLFVEMIDCQPTAYDIDKVIKELINNTQECTDRITYETHSFVPLFDAIKIVKGGLDGSRNDSTSR